MSKPDPTTEDWYSCPAGELQRVARRVQNRRRQQVLGKASWTGGIVVVLVVVAGLMSRGSFAPKGYNFGEISCRDVQSMLASYDAGTLEPTAREQVRLHLERCPHCGPLYRGMSPEISETAGSQDAMIAVQALKPQRSRTVALAGEDHHGSRCSFRKSFSYQKRDCQQTYEMNI